MLRTHDEPGNSRTRGVLARVAPGLIVAGFAAAVYGGLNLARPSDLSPQLNYVLVQPLLWLSLAGVAFLAWRLGPQNRPRATSNLIFWAMLLGAFQVALWLLAGVLFGFGFSLFAHTVPGLLANMVLVGSVLLAVELSRAVLVTTAIRNSALAVLATSLFLTWLRVPPARWTMAAQPGAIGPFLGEMLLPYFAEDLLASSLALLGGPLPALIYRGALQAYQWLFPILPQLPWTVTAFVGTLGPGLGLILLQASRAPSSSGARRDLGGVWPIVGVAMVALLWFNVGLFGVQPTLITGGSMEPVLHAGDVVVIREVRPEQIHPGDIVRFRHEAVHVVHRVAEVQQSPEGLVFITHGDANNRLDPPVPAERIEGKVVFVIPKVGWISIALRQVLQWAG